MKNRIAKYASSVPRQSLAARVSVPIQNTLPNITPEIKLAGVLDTETIVGLHRIHQKPASTPHRLRRTSESLGLIDPFFELVEFFDGSAAFELDAEVPRGWITTTHARGRVGAGFDSTATELIG